MCTAVAVCHMIRRRDVPSLVVVHDRADRALGVLQGKAHDDRRVWKPVEIVGADGVSIARVEMPESAVGVIDDGDAAVLEIDDAIDFSSGRSEEHTSELQSPC